MTAEAKAAACGARQRVYRVLDMINTHETARELLDHRVAQVNATGRYDNAICCSRGEYVERLRARGHTVHVLDTPRTLAPLGIAVAIWRTFRLLRKHRFDVIHTHTSVVGTIGRVAAWLARTPVIIHQVHGFHHHANMPPRKRRVFIGAERCLALFADRLLFQNQRDIEECMKRHIAPRRKLVLVGNGVQLDSFRVDVAPKNCPPVVLCVGRLESVKNHPMIFVAARILKERGVAFVLKIAGEGELRPTYEAWIRDHGMEDHVHLLGYRDDVPALTARADVCALVSRKEGLPRAILEAAASGRPMVATDVVGNRDTVIDGVTGFLVPLDDATALADRLQALLSDAPLREKLGRQARAHAEAHFDERAVTERIVAVYDQTLALTHC